jgi:phage tail protein X
MLNQLCTSVQCRGSIVHISTVSWINCAHKHRVVDQLCTSVQCRGSPVNISTVSWINCAHQYSVVDQLCTSVQCRVSTVHISSVSWINGAHQFSVVYQLCTPVQCRGSTVHISTVSWLSQRQYQHITCKYRLTKNPSLEEQNTSLHHSVKFTENSIFCSKDNVCLTAISVYRICL